MSVEVTLPSLGVAILEATVVKWLKEEGQPVGEGGTHRGWSSR